MIRPATPDDQKALIAIAEAIGLFSPQELEELSSMLAEYFNGNLGSDRFWSVYDDGKPVGVAYYAPEPYADGTWNLSKYRTKTQEIEENQLLIHLNLRK